MDKDHENQKSIQPSQEPSQVSADVQPNIQPASPTIATSNTGLPAAEPQYIAQIQKQAESAEATQEETDISRDENERPSFFRTFLSIIEFFGTVGILVFVILSFGLQSFHVVGSSMTPTLQEGDRLLVSKIGRTWGKLTNDPYIPDRGTIIVFKSPTDGIELVKRVIGLPGERVVLESGKFTVYNEEKPGGFNPDSKFSGGDNLEYTAGNVNIIVPEGEIFVTGDNRTPGGSLDSRNSLGTVPVDNIDGKLVLRVLPITEAKTF